MSAEKASLLHDEECSLPDDQSLDQRRRHRVACCSLDSAHQSLDHRGSHSLSFLFRGYLLVLHLLCFCLVVALFLTVSHISNLDLAMLDFDSRYPDWVPISYELLHENPLENPQSKFDGMPNEANTKAWDDLITPTFFSVSEAELQKTGESVNDSVRLAKGGYMAGLGVYHNIHCLRRLRLYLHAEYYYDSFTAANMDYLYGHLGHCIESLRRSIMCNADTSIYTFTWEDATLVRPGIWRPEPKSNQDRKCIKWETLENWVMERHIPLNPVLLKPGGEEEKILMV
ncbi:putative Tat pathway signal sequence [Seiridium unicorne]|uniref:Tat pathway signal sequence n=1 Tax=Seiridium unicorne TaxID=138068 RepID=A0ABR2UXG6_9PEZI